MAYVKKVWPEYSFEEIKSVALLCESKEEFRNKYKIYYDYCIRKKIRKEILAFIPHKKKWTKEALIVDAQKYKTISEWMYNNISAYNTALKKDFYDECIEHMKRGFFGPYQKWNYDTIKEIYSKFTNIKELRINETAAYNTAIRNGWHKELSKDLIRGFEHAKRKWTYEAVKAEAMKYNSIKDLQKNNSSAYCTALKNKWLMDIIGHMDGGNTKWNIEKLVGVLSKYPKNQWYKYKDAQAAFTYVKRHNLTNMIEKELNK